MEILDYLKKITNKKYSDSLIALYNDVEPKLKAMPASIRWHHSEEGGLYRHLKEVIQLALAFYDDVRVDLRKLAITENDIILVGFIHDLEKINKYKKNKEYDPEKKYTKGYKETEFLYNYDKINLNDTAEVTRICAQYGLLLSDMHIHAVTYHHGGWSVDIGYNSNLKPLAAILHAADLVSTTLYKDKGN